MTLAIEEQHPQQLAGGIKEMHRDDADRAGAAEGSGGHGWAGERHHRHAPAPPAPRKGRAATRVSPCAVRNPGQDGCRDRQPRKVIVTSQSISAIARRKSKRRIQDLAEARGEELGDLQICLGTKPSARKMSLKQLSGGVFVPDADDSQNHCPDDLLEICNIGICNLDRSTV